MTWSIKQYRTHTAAYRRSGRARLNIGDLRAFLIEAEEALLRRQRRRTHPRHEQWEGDVMELSEFLLARIGEDEEVAQLAALTVGWDGYGDQRIRSGQHWTSSYHIVKRQRDGGPTERTVADSGSFIGMDRAPHIARHDPARVLAECEAKRRIVDLHRAVPVAPGRRGLTCVEDGALTWPCPTLRFLAAPYADHPDYRGAWRP